MFKYYSRTVYYEKNYKGGDDMRKRLILFGFLLLVLSFFLVPFSSEPYTNALITKYVLISSEKWEVKERTIMANNTILIPSYVPLAQIVPRKYLEKVHPNFVYFPVPIDLDYMTVRDVHLIVEFSSDQKFDAGIFYLEDYLNKWLDTPPSNRLPYTDLTIFSHVFELSPYAILRNEVHIALENFNYEDAYVSATIKLKWTELVNRKELNILQIFLEGIGVIFFILGVFLVILGAV